MGKHVRDFDRDYAEEIVRRLATLEPERKPQWGVMQGRDLIPHLTHTLLWSMNRREPPRFVGNWATKHILGPLVIRGWVPVKKNIKINGVDGNGTDTLYDLKAALEDYLSAVETGAIQTAAHPFFGDIGVDGWARMHIKHFEHHFKQFNL
jgi:hydroxymethylglutaryl-CoA reductase